LFINDLFIKLFQTIAPWSYYLVRKDRHTLK
jgi:hypothetical protein